MDKKSIIGFVVIGIILIAWMMWTSKNQKPQTPPNQNVTTVQDSGKSKVSTDSIKIIKKDTAVVNEYSTNFGNTFARSSVQYAKDSLSASERIFTVEIDKYRFEFSNFGGALLKAYLKKFATWDGKEVQLVDWKKERELNLMFTSKEGVTINTRDLLFNQSDYPHHNVNLTESKDFTLKYTLILNSDSSQKIVKTYTFIPDSYEFMVDYEFSNPSKFIADNKYQVVWGSSLNLTEFRSDEEARFSAAYSYMGGELEEMMPSDFNKEEKFDANGNTDYVATRNKYFGVFIIPFSRKGDGAYLTGNKMHLPDEGQKNLFSAAVKMDIKNDAYEKSTFKILLSPVDYKILKAYNMELEKTMRFSLDWLVRPIAQYAIIPFFNFLHLFIPNWGVVIIVFAIVLKIVLNPLTKKQMTSMRKMSTLNPKMTEIREKYKDDPQKMNSMIMKLYKEEGINPMGGCLPMLLQLPILYALFGVFQSTIELRQASFIWWITDLSAPDVLFHLPFKIPLFGINQVSGLATLMGITMFIQQKMTVTDPKQKSLVYIMPIMMTLLFFGFPSGLNLYYFMFNLLSIGQQYYTTKIRPPKEDEIKKPVKPGMMARFMERMQQQQKEMNKRRKR